MMKARKTSLIRCLAAATVLAAACQPAAAQSLRSSIGLRTGFSVSPDQFSIGVQARLGEFSIGRFAPSVDFGFGDNVTLTTFNFDVQADLLSLPGTGTSFYGGAGPTISIIDPERGKSDTEIGLSFVGGVKVPFSPASYYNVEARLGVGDIPDFKLLIGAMIGFHGF